MIITESINNRTIGVNFLNGCCSASVWAPEAKSVELVAENGNKFKLNKTERGYWKGDFTDLMPGIKYKFSLDFHPK